MGEQGGERSRALLRGIIGALKWFVYSNLYLAIFGHVAMTAAMMVLLRVPVNTVLLLISFSGSMLIYSVNRHLDRQEDLISLPERSDFTTRYGRFMSTVSIPLFGIALLLAFRENGTVLMVVLFPFVLGILYSYFRLKRIFFLKNLIVSVGVSTTLLMVVAAYQVPFGTWLPLFAILLSALLVNTIIFDIKDITGDRFAGIRTLPAALGVENTRWFCGILLVPLALLSGYLIPTDRIFWALVPYLLYIGTYIVYVPAGSSPWWYYGLIVDGEYLPLLCFSLLFR